MIKNMGKTDRIIRLVVAALIGVLYFTNQITGTVAIILGVVAIILALTALVGTCPAYMPFRFNTCERK